MLDVQSPESTTNFDMTTLIERGSLSSVIKVLPGHDRQGDPIGEDSLRRWSTDSTMRSSLLTNSAYLGNSDSFERNSLIGFEASNCPPSQSDPLTGCPRRTYPYSTEPTMSTIVSQPDAPLQIETKEPKRRKKIWRRLRIFRILKFPFIWRGSGKPMSEARMRKRLRKLADKGDWNKVRKLITSHDFSNIPELLPMKAYRTLSRISNGSLVLASQHGRKLPHEPGCGDRRSSFGDRSSLSQNDSDDVAAVVKKVMREENFSNLDLPNIGENILHDICRRRPPVDVLESLLAALRHRRGFTTGQDELGRTPLHVAAACGASPEIIDMLARVDPSPATLGDINCRSPLHLAMKLLAYGEVDQASHALPSIRRSMTLDTPPCEEAVDKAFRTAAILKDVMLTFPGKIDFKDEDNTGFTPLDYALDGSVSEERLIQSLMRRKEPKQRSTRLSDASADTQIAKNRFVAPRRLTTLSSSSSCLSQDMSVLLKLEQEEIDARKHRIMRIKAKLEEEHMNDALFDVFGIEETPHHATTKGQAQELEIENEKECIISKEVSPQSVREKKANSQRTPTAENDNLSQEIISEEINDEHNGLAIHQMTDEDIYQHHLQAYLDDFMDAEVMGDLDRFDHHEFDLEDMDEDNDLAEQRALQEENEQLQYRAKIAEENSYFHNGDMIPPISEVTIRDGDHDELYDHCDNISEISTPAELHLRSSLR